MRPASENVAMPMSDHDEKRLAFGRVAELYDRTRPSYPEAAIADLIAWAGLRGSETVLEVGAGTGKATLMLAARGLRVLALEPDSAMAEVARGNCTSSPSVEIEVIEFEKWRPCERRFAAVVAAQAWHWIAPDLRYVRAAEALRRGGTLAAIWTFPRWETTPLGEALRRAYAEGAPELARDFPMHPASEPSDLAGDWHLEIHESDLFSSPEVREYPWSLSFATEQYIALVQTHQDHILMEERQREVLLAAVSRTIENAGGSIVVDFVTRLCLARRV